MGRRQRELPSTLIPNPDLSQVITIPVAKEAENARKNRTEIVKALSLGQVTRRDLIKMGLFTGAGLLMPLEGLNPFVGSARADGGSNIPTGLPPSPLFGVQPFSQVMPRFDVLPRKPYSTFAAWTKSLVAAPPAGGPLASTMERGDKKASPVRVPTAS
jgi:manganese oxidase